MKRLKDRLGANGPGLTVAVIAMILALSGAAFAASGALTGKQKKEVEKIAKKFAGKPGEAGKSGAQGPAGAKGDPGANGTNGVNGSSVVASPEPTGTLNCAGRGGSKFAVGAAAPTFACNGKEGEEGSPWTVGGTLPSGEMETGSWVMTGTVADTEGTFAALSFPLPLEEELDATHVVWVVGFPNPEGCNGTATAPNPKPGYLCVYPSNEGAVNTEFERIEEAGKAKEGLSGASPSGARIKFEPPTGVAFASGTFAVRAPEAP
jgi:hypothetical protein